MQGKAVWATLSKYISSLVLTILVPLQWLRVWKVAGEHKALDRNAKKKVATAIVAGIVLFGVSAFVVMDFQDDATQGTYETLSGRLSQSLGNEAYKAALADQETAQNLIDIADRKIEEAQQEGDAEEEQLWRDNRAGYVTDLNDARDREDSLEPNAQLFAAVQSTLLEDRDDEHAKQLIAADADLPGVNEQRSQVHFDKKDQTIQDMRSMLIWFVYPGLIGVLWAPLAYAAGHILKTTFVPSETVGFKPYPGGAAALVLLFGAFGVPALFFAAWVMQDFVDRTVEGQISL